MLIKHQTLEIATEQTSIQRNRKFYEPKNCPYFKFVFILGIIGFMLLCILVNVDFHPDSKKSRHPRRNTKPQKDFFDKAEFPENKFLHEFHMKTHGNTNQNFKEVAFSSVRLIYNMSHTQRKKIEDYLEFREVMGNSESTTIPETLNYRSDLTLLKNKERSSTPEICNTIQIVGILRVVRETLAHRNLPDYDFEDVWLTDDDVAWFIIIIIIASLHFGVIGMIIVYFVLRRRPTWLYTKSPRIVRMSQRCHKIILLPKRRRESRTSLDSRHRATYLCPQPRTDVSAYTVSTSLAVNLHCPPLEAAPSIPNIYHDLPASPACSAAEHMPPSSVNFDQEDITSSAACSTTEDTPSSPTDFIKQDITSSPATSLDNDINYSNLPFEYHNGPACSAAGDMPPYSFNFDQEDIASSPPDFMEQYIPSSPASSFDNDINYSNLPIEYHNGSGSQHVDHYEEIVRSSEEFHLNMISGRLIRGICAIAADHQLTDHYEEVNF